MKLTKDQETHVINNLIDLFNSCAEAVSGEWDVTSENEDGFHAMQEQIVDIANILELELPDNRLKQGN